MKKKGISLASPSLYILFYGLYYGVLARDCAQLCSDRIASTLGFFSQTGFPRKRVPRGICAICNESLPESYAKVLFLFFLLQFCTDIKTKKKCHKNKKLDTVERGPITTNSKKNERIKIDCGHEFHPFCIRGWVMIGKKAMCPVCKGI